MKIHILGASGSGVTTLGQVLADKLEVPYFDADSFYWEKSDPPFTVKRKPADRNAMLATALTRAEHWVLGGSALNWGDKLLPEFDLVVFLWLPPATRIKRLEQREIERYGDIIFTDPARNKQYLDFMDWARDYDHDTGVAKRTLNLHESWLSSIDCPVLRIEGDFSVEKRMELVLEILGLED
ncbi:MAG: adenylate kinase [Bacteroidota bacterium]